MFDNVRADIKRYTRLGLVEFWDPTLWVILSYRFGRWVRGWRSPWRLLGMAIDAPVYYVLTLLVGVHLPRNAMIGGGLRIWHFGGVFVNRMARIGRNCTLRENVCIGNRYTDIDVPTIGDDVEIGVGAVIIGDISIGDRVSVGANAVVLKDVPCDSTAVGNPARILPKGSSRIRHELTTEAK